MSAEELFARLLFWGRNLLYLDEDEIWLYPIGDLMDQIEIYRQFYGISKRKDIKYIDEVDI